MKICLFGASSSRLSPVYFREAEAMGRLLAEGGHSVVFGGGADGLMGACARGAKAAGIRREICRGRLRGEAEDLSVFQKDIQPRVDALRRVDDPSVSDQVFHSVPFLLFLSVLTCIVTSAAPCAFAASVVYCPQDTA